MTSQPPSEVDEDEEKVLKRKQKHEANLTAGMGYGNAKKRQLEVFWNVIWPQLCEDGWSKVGPVRPSTNCTSSTYNPLYSLFSA
jgi:hypothetical protein